MEIKKREFLIRWEISWFRHFYLERVADEVFGRKAIYEIL
jgi:hypothetical protein